MDALSWCIVVSTVLLFALIVWGYLRRADAIPNWPTAVASVTEITSYRGVPLSKYHLEFDHCKVYYTFSVGSKTYEGWFVLTTEEHGFADDSAEKLRGKDVTIRYNPKRPKDSLVLENTVLGKKVIQSQNFL